MPASRSSGTASSRARGCRWTAWPARPGSVGTAGQTAQQAGYTFQFDQPADGRTKQIRAVADVQWRDGDQVVRSSQAVTQAGMASDVGGSQAACALS